MATPSHPITIAIDGYSSSGKSTMARRLAATVGYRYVDSGAMYRAVTLAAMRRGLFDGTSEPDPEQVAAILPALSIDFRPAAGGQITLLDGEPVETEIRSMAVSSHVSYVAAIPAVRRALVKLQQAYGLSGGIVMDGRDIGTTVFPKAELKVFVTSDPEIRAARRFKELTDKGVLTSYEDVLTNVRERDHLDETRAESPLRQAPDAVVLDNSHLTPEQQDERLLDLFRQRTLS